MFGQKGNTKHQATAKSGSLNLVQTALFLMARGWGTKVNPTIHSASSAPKEKITLLKPLQMAKQPTNYPFRL